MTSKLSSLYKILEIPGVYSITQSLLGPGAKENLSQILETACDRKANWVLDVGCGPEAFFPGAGKHLVGLDMSLSYLNSYTSTNQADSRLAVGASADSLPFSSESFDECRCIGLLHHLPDNIALTAIRQMLTVLKPGGRLVIFDNVWPNQAWKRPLAWLIRRLDRGKWIRSESELIKLCREAQPEGWKSSRHSYSPSGLEGLLLVFQKTHA